MFPQGMVTDTVRNINSLREYADQLILDRIHQHSLHSLWGRKGGVFFAKILTGVAGNKALRSKWLKGTPFLSTQKGWFQRKGD